MLPFDITARDPATAARAGELATPHGTVRTPAFMPVGTAGSVKGIAAWELERLAPEMVLSNTYHLMLRPGPERLRRLGGLHRLMAWHGPILTDSGGYQVFSLAGRRELDED
ncbi:MAG TPA: tRNA-guanine transglycosylase, partial [Acidobacteria bacterium]|nr:tRNA-guanine transglycosylase [Acidobacteriota bacterium]